MNIFQCAKAYILRNPMKNIILCVIFVLIFLGELIGLCVYSVARKGEEDAFIYHGSDLIIEGENLHITTETYEKIKSIDHVIGINNWKENLAIPVGLSNVKNHTGVEPGVATEEVTWSTNSVVLVALMNTELYSWFRWEKSVSLISGTYPTSENQGVLIESRFAEQNNLSVGDSVTFTIEESGNNCTCKVCGIYRVDSDFEITESNNLGEGVYKYSPYNVIYQDYEYASKTIGFESNAPYGFELYVDNYDSINEVGSELRNLLGKDAEIYNTASGYLNNERSIVVLMKNYSFTILVYVSLIGGIIMLLVLTFYASQYQRDSGIFLALGCRKVRIVLQYFLSMLIIIIGAFVISSVIYHYSADIIVNSINGIAKKTISQNFNEVLSAPYITPQLGQGFMMDVNISGMLNLTNYVKIFAIGVGFLLLSMAIPIYSIMTTKPKFLLSNK